MLSWRSVMCSHPAPDCPAVEPTIPRSACVSCRPQSTCIHAPFGVVELVRHPDRQRPIPIGSMPSTNTHKPSLDQAALGLQPSMIGPCSLGVPHRQVQAKRCPQPDAVVTDRRDATLRLTLNPRRTPARGPDGWTNSAAGCCCAPSPTRPRLGPGPSAAASSGFSPTVTSGR